MRPTGKLHLGHLVGALDNWASLQDRYDCFYFVADWHALTSDYADTSEIVANVRHGGRLGGGRPRPGRSTLFVQSLVPEHAELYLLLSMTIPIPWLERVPTYKEQIEQLAEKDLSTLGFLGYPLLQTADIIIYNARYVPVGEDQVAHLELSREIVAAFTLLRRAVRRARGDADRLQAPARPRQPQDVQELRQRDQPLGRRGDRSEEGHADVPTRSEFGPMCRGRSKATPSSRIIRRSILTPRKSRISRRATGRESRRRRGEDETGQSAQRLPRADPRQARRRPGQAGSASEILHEGSRKARAVAQETMERVRGAVKLDYR